jgi:hypothetical protein
MFSIFHILKCSLALYILRHCFSYRNLSPLNFISRGFKFSNHVKLDRNSNLETEIPLADSDRVVPIELNDELKSSFMAYAMSTILSRALPDARDGMKPVHRRVLYAMQGLGLTPESGYRKCARIVGEVLGKYHPHGDQSGTSFSNVESVCSLLLHEIVEP